MILPAALDTEGTTPRRRNSRTASRAHKKLTGQVDAEHLIPLLQRHLMKRRVALQAGVADENVDCAELLHHPREHRSDLIFRGNVRLMRDRLWRRIS